MAVFTVAATALRTAACIINLGSDMIYFNDRSLLFASVAILATGFAAMILLTTTMPKEEIRVPFSAQVLYVPVGLSAIATALFAISMLSVYKHLGGLLVTSPTLKSAEMLSLITAFLAPLSVVHLFLSVYIPERRSVLRAYFSMATVLMLACYASFLYFSPATPLNSINKITEQMACLIAAIFFLFEARISLGREMMKLHSAFGTVAAMITAYASIPSIITYFVRGTTPGFSIEAAAMLLSISLFIFARLCTLAIASPDRESDEMAALREYAQRREAELTDGRIEDGTQISITDLMDIPKDAGASEDREESDTASDAESTSQTNNEDN